MTEPATSPSLPAMRATSAASGLRWWTESFSWLFGDLARLGVWIGMLLCSLLVLTPLHWIPLFGSVAWHLLWFVLAGGLMVAARNTQRGQVPHFRELFAGFGPQGGALIGAALVVLAASLAVVGLMFAIGLSVVIGSLASAASFQTMAASPQALASLGTGSLVLLLLCQLLFVPISMAAWLAPALIMLRGAGPLDALRWSLAACRRYLGALTVYGLVGAGLAVLATLMFLLGWLFLLPLIFLSTYAAYDEIFAAEGQAEPSAAPPSG